MIQANWKTALLDYKTNKETALDDIPGAVRVYPASAASIMLPLTPANNWTATIVFCGGSDVKPDQYSFFSRPFLLLFINPAYRWSSPNFIPTIRPASSSCVRITPDINSSYVEDDPMLERHTMSNLIALPDGKILDLNGASLGEFSIQLQL